MEKIIVYTCITGGYDTLMQPYLPADGFEFICFVGKGEKKAEKVGVWKIEEIPFDWDDRQLVSRYPKINPQSALPENSRWSLWIDGNIRIKDGSIYELCRDLQRKCVRYAGIRHPFNDCVYEEAVKCLVDRRDSFHNIFKTVRFLRKNAFPEHAGLMENNIIFRSHNDEAVVRFDRWWWECFLALSHRDQLTHSFCLKGTTELQADLLFPEGITARNHRGLEYVLHPKPELNWIQRKLKYGLNKPEAAILRAYIRLSRPKKTKE